MLSLLSLKAMTTYCLEEKLATLTIRNLDEETKAKLRQLAAKHGHSMEEEVRRILNRTVNQEENDGLGTEITQLFAKIGGVDLQIPLRSPVRTVQLFAEDET
jgi:plasmid stability protein